MKFLALALVLIIQVGCREKEKHNFAFIMADTSELSPLSEKNFQPRLFKIHRAPISFPENSTLYIHYKPDKIDYLETYALALSKRSLGFIQVDLRNVKINQGIGAMINKYSDLEPGQYKLEVANSEGILNEIVFTIRKAAQQELIDFTVGLEDL